MALAMGRCDLTDAQQLAQGCGEVSLGSELRLQRARGLQTPATASGAEAMAGEFSGQLAEPFVIHAETPAMEGCDLHPIGALRQEEQIQGGAQDVIQVPLAHVQGLAHWDQQL
jgi:hypothetical protein